MNFRDKQLSLCPTAKQGSPRRLRTVLAAACVALLLVGCSTSGEVDPNSMGGMLEDFVAFLQDFARQSLAAYLL